MKIIQPSFSIIDQDFGIDGIFRQIELAGRTCYRSEDRITETSAKVFVERMIASGHTAMLEHGTVYLAIPMETTLPTEANGWDKYVKNPYSKGGIVCYVNGEKRVAVTTNYRVLVENKWLDDLQFICNPTIYHARRVTVKFICDRGVSHEFVRHRVFSFAQESTRYCNYTKEKHGGELTFIIPSWVDNIREGRFDDTLGYDYAWHAIDGGDSLRCDDAGACFMSLCNKAESSYIGLLAAGWSPQQARNVLPNAIKTTLVMTGFVEDWQHFFDLRALGTTGKPHPDASYLAIPLYNEFKKRGLL